MSATKERTQTIQEKRTAISFCCPNCGSNNIASFESASGDFDHGLYHVWLREECWDCQTTFTTIMHPAWIEDIDVPQTAVEAAKRRKKHIDAGLHPSDDGFGTGPALSLAPADGVQDGNKST